MSNEIKNYKVVSALPSELETNSIYFVRVNGGFDFYVTTSTTPVIAKKINENDAVMLITGENFQIAYQEIMIDILKSILLEMKLLNRRMDLMIESGIGHDDLLSEE